MGQEHVVDTGQVRPDVGVEHQGPTAETDLDRHAAPPGNCDLVFRRARSRIRHEDVELVQPVVPLVLIVVVRATRDVDAAVKQAGAHPGLALGVVGAGGPAVGARVVDLDRGHVSLRTDPANAPHPRAVYCDGEAAPRRRHGCAGGPAADLGIEDEDIATDRVMHSADGIDFPAHRRDAQGLTAFGKRRAGLPGLGTRVVHLDAIQEPFVRPIAPDDVQSPVHGRGPAPGAGRWHRRTDDPSVIGGIVDVQAVAEFIVLVVTAFGLLLLAAHALATDTVDVPTDHGRTEPTAAIGDRRRGRPDAAHRVVHFDHLVRGVAAAGDVTAIQRHGPRLL